MCQRMRSNTIVYVVDRTYMDFFFTVCSFFALRSRACAHTILYILPHLFSKRQKDKLDQLTIWSRRVKRILYIYTYTNEREGEKRANSVFHIESVCYFTVAFLCFAAYICGGGGGVAVFFFLHRCRQTQYKISCYILEQYMHVMSCSRLSNFCTLSCRRRRVFFLA